MEWNKDADWREVKSDIIRGFVIMFRPNKMESRKNAVIENDCLVSVIIPVFNEKQFLNEALDSVIYQSYDNLEIIIIDDGSTDGSGEICDGYSRNDNRIRVIHQKNRGLSAARNTGINIATGDFIAFLDSDDAYHPEFVETMVGAAIKGGVNLVVCKFTVHRTIGKMNLENRERKIKPSICSGLYDRVDSLRFLVDGRIDSTAWNKLYDRSLWQGIRYPEGHVYEDVATTYKIIDLCDRICVVDQPLLSHRKHRGSITDTSSQQNINDKILASSQFTSFVEDNTPKIFTQEQLERRLQSNLNAMISLFIRCSERSPSDVYRERLRKRIIKAGAEIGISRCQIRTRIGYQMVCSCPWLLRYVFQGYSIARRLTRF